MADSRKRAASYIWTPHQERPTGRQMVELAYLADRAGWRFVFSCIYTDAGDASAGPASERPGFGRMLRDAAARKFDVLMVSSIEQLGRSLEDLAATLAVLQTAGVALYVKEQAIDPTTPAGEALFRMARIFADAEQAMRRARLRAGIARARQGGKRLGRPKVDPARAAAIRASLAGGASIRRTAKLHGVGVSTVQRLKAMPAGEEPAVDPGVDRRA